ncbi:MAG: hypothetical protein OEW78_06970 [Nitrosopumilus sp.]|uniref:hypothetical protein n=1 Tax=Nitrosopumilus sp. TaxID=2024843 RepID=UPI002470CE7A|nr:hypothetical protein [Nitrosopumilus sp.]MDH5431606.1 hypothetical protein [Nitrosopumilus sp.]
MTYKTMGQKTCYHDAKVKMVGYKNLYECIRCHKFLSVPVSNKIDYTLLAS